MVSIGVQNLGAGFTFGYRGKAQPGATFPNEPTIEASDAGNAGELAALGYVAYPLTDWTTTQKITVNGFAFHWNGTAWAAGAHA